jgi:hypothetical protein
MYKERPNRQNETLYPLASIQRHVAPQAPPPERVETPHLHHRAPSKPQGTVRTTRPIPHPIQTTKGQHRRQNLLQHAAADLVGRGSHLSECSRHRALMLVPRLPPLGTSVYYLPTTTSRRKRCPQMCSIPPRATELMAPPEGNRCGKSQISGSEGAGRAAGSGLRWHRPKSGTLRLREHLVQALSPPASPAVPPPATFPAIFAVFGSRVFKKFFPEAPDLTSIFSARSPFRQYSDMTCQVKP